MKSYTMLASTSYDLNSLFAHKKANHRGKKLFRFVILLSSQIYVMRPYFIFLLSFRLYFQCVLLAVLLLISVLLFLTCLFVLIFHFISYC